MTAFPNLPADHPANRAPEAQRLRNGTQFEAKYDFEGRCGMAASLLAGFSVNQVAAAFGVNRRTVTKILPQASKHYRAVRDELSRLGREEFVKRYFTEAVYERISKAADDPKASMTYRDADKVSASGHGPNKRATSNEGVALHPHGGKTHRINVQWRDDAIVSGWYFQPMDVEGLEAAWLGDDEGKPFHSSATALSAAKRWLIDNE